MENKATGICKKELTMFGDRFFLDCGLEHERDSSKQLASQMERSRNGKDSQRVSVYRKINKNCSKNW